jgi:hypothetical protein
LGFKHKKEYFNPSGNLKYSFINSSEDKTGFSSNLNFAETSGNYRYSFNATSRPKIMTMTLVLILKLLL